MVGAKGSSAGDRTQNGKGVLRGVSDIIAPSSGTGASARAIGGGAQGYPSGEGRGLGSLS